MPPQPATGVVTLVFTDIQGSSGYWERFQDAFKPCIDLHHAIMQGAIRASGGLEVGYEGDSFMVSFADAGDAVRFAVAAQRELRAAPWPPEVGEVRVRIGMHTGEPIMQVDPNGIPRYFGPSVNRAARVSAAAHGGQILISNSTRLQAVLDPEYHLVSLGRHRLKGLEEEEEIWEVHHPSLQERSFPPLRTLSVRRHNLPASATSFVGREDDLRDLRDLLRSDGIRMVTLLGMGGMGKTRLSLRTAEDLIEQFRDGVWYAELETARRVEEALERLLAALSMQPQPGVSLRVQLLEYLAERELLLVLDNCEQLDGAGALVADILRAAPGVKVLVTSRTLLRCRGERVYEVTGLGCPPAGAGCSLAALLAYPGVALFTERAQAVAPGWELDRENSAAVAELCRRLDGQPLALELAATRVRGMTPEEILQRLSDRFRVLSSRASDVPERQRTLRGAIDWSYNLLEPEEQEFFAQLSVFRGGFWLEAAEAVTRNDFALDLILSLQDKSLVSARTVEQRTRYLLLESLRDYGAERLAALGATAELEERHARHYAARLTEFLGAERSHNDPAFTARLVPDLENCRAALENARKTDPILASRIATAGSRLLHRSGFWVEARSWAEQSVAIARAEESDGLLAGAAIQLARILSDTNQLDAALAASVAGADAAERAGDGALQTAALNLQGVVLLELRRYPEARQRCVEALALAESRDDRVSAGVVLHNLAYLSGREGSGEEALAEYRRLLAIRRELGDTRGVGETLNNLGSLLYDRDLEAARDCFAECVTLWRDLGDELGTAMAHHNLGEVHLELDHLDEAEAELFEAHRLFQSLGSPFAEASSQLLEQAAARRESLGTSEPHHRGTENTEDHGEGDGPL